MNPNQHADTVYNCDALLELIPEYAFGLTDADQTRIVEANLERCPAATARLQEYRHLQDEMRGAVPQVAPPPNMGARLMAAIAEQTPAPAPAAAPLQPPALVPAPPVVSAKPRRAIRIAWLVAAAAVLVLVGTNIFWLSRVAELTQSTNLLNTLLAAQTTNPFVLTGTEGLHWVRLADAQEAGADTAAFMMWNEASKTGLLYAHAFPELQPGYRYHVWLTRPDERVFMGILQVDEEGNGALLFNSPEPIDDFSWAWVTAETGNGIPDAPAVVKGELGDPT